MSHAHPAERDHLVFDQQSQTLLLAISYGMTSVLLSPLIWPPRTPRAPDLEKGKIKIPRSSASRPAMAVPHSRLAGSFAPARLRRPDPNPQASPAASACAQTFRLSPRPS